MQAQLGSLLRNGFTVGLELPLDNDWSTKGQARRVADGRLPGEPDMAAHARLAQLADSCGFAALWVRDVPLYDPQFGDAAQTFEIFTYLGYLAASTRNILLGTSAVVLPLREPVLTMKSASTLDRLSSGRLILGVSSGDRPVEYPIFRKDFRQRGAAFRQQIDMLRDWRSQEWPEAIQLLPKPRAPLPLLAAGLAQQTLEWIGQNLDGWLAYPGTPQEHLMRSAAWRSVAGPDKPYISFIHLDYLPDPSAPSQRFRFGLATGRQGLIRELQAMRQAGVGHIALHMRRTSMDLEQAIADIGSQVLPCL